LQLFDSMPAEQRKHNFAAENTGAGTDVPRRMRRCMPARRPGGAGYQEGKACLNQEVLFSAAAQPRHFLMMVFLMVSDFPRSKTPNKSGAYWPN
jgi:hypothetical protein